MSTTTLSAKRPAHRAPVHTAGTHHEETTGEPCDGLAEALLTHLQAQLDSACALLEIVLEQGAAIRARDVHAVVRLAGVLRGEVSRRQTLEAERDRLLARGGELLGGAAPREVTLSRLCALIDHDSAARARESSARLQGMVRELQREHVCNGALMKVELSFLDHLLGTLALGRGEGYDAQGASARGARTRPRGALHVLDLHA